MKKTRISIVKVLTLIVFLSLSVSEVNANRLFKGKNISTRGVLAKHSERHSRLSIDLAEIINTTEPLPKVELSKYMGTDAARYAANLNLIVQQLQLKWPTTFSDLIRLNQYIARKSNGSLRQSEINDFILKITPDVWRVGGYLFDNRKFSRTALMQFSESMKFMSVEHRTGDENTQIVIVRMEYANSFRDNLFYNSESEKDPKFEIQSIIAITSGVNIPQYTVTKMPSKWVNQSKSTNNSDIEWNLSEKIIARKMTEEEKELIRETMAHRAMSLIQSNLPKGNSNQELSYFREMKMLKEYYNFVTEISVELQNTGYDHMMSGRFLDEINNVSDDFKIIFQGFIQMLNLNTGVIQMEKEFSRSTNMEAYIICIPDPKNLYFLRLQKTSESTMNIQVKQISVDGVLPEVLAVRTSSNTTWSTILKGSSKQFPDHNLIKRAIDDFIRA